MSNQVICFHFRMFVCLYLLINEGLKKKKRRKKLTGKKGGRAAHADRFGEYLNHMDLSLTQTQSKTLNLKKPTTHRHNDKHADLSPPPKEKHTHNTV